MIKDPYFDKPGVSSHMLADFRRDGPLYYYRKHVQKAIEDRDSAAFCFGRALHALTLEGAQALEARFIVAPAEHLAPSGNLSTKVATKEWKAQQDKSVLTPNENEMIWRMAVEVRRVAAHLLVDGKPEVERFAQHASGLAIKGKADWDAGTYGCDLKSCQSLDSFEADARRYGYVEQGAFYRDLFGWDAYFLLAAEKEGKRVGVYRVSNDALDAASIANDRALTDLAERFRTDEWSDGALVLVA